MTSGCFSQCLPYSARSCPLWNKAAQSAFKRSSRFIHLDADDFPAAFSALWRVMKRMAAVLTRHSNLHLHSWACRENSPALPPGLKSRTWVPLSWHAYTGKDLSFLTFLLLFSTKCLCSPFSGLWLILLNYCVDDSVPDSFTVWKNKHLLTLQHFIISYYWHLQIMQKKLTCLRNRRREKKKTLLQKLLCNTHSFACTECSVWVPPSTC